jgi:major histocompatibility complex class I
MKSLKIKKMPGVVEHTFNHSTWEAEAGAFLSSRPAWSTE